MGDTMKKSLLDIQQEIRELDYKVKEISTSISEIYNELDEFRNSGEDESYDYEMIRMMARHFSFGTHPLNELNDEHTSRLYLETLLSLVQMDSGSEYTTSRMIFIQWILAQSKLKNDLESLYKEAFKLDIGSYSELVENIPHTYREQLILDALLTANICSQANDEVLLYIVNLCSILGIDKEQLEVLSIVAKIVLKQNIVRAPKKVLSAILTFKHYLASDMYKEMFWAHRTIVVEAPDDSHWMFKWKFKQYDMVKKGDVIAIYRKGTWNGKEEDFKAPCSGKLFQFRHNNTNYGVIANENDSKDAIKDWVIKGKK